MSLGPGKVADLLIKGSENASADYAFYPHRESLNHPLLYYVNLRLGLFLL